MKIIIRRYGLAVIAVLAGYYLSQIILSLNNGVSFSPVKPLFFMVLCDGLLFRTLDDLNDYNDDLKSKKAPVSKTGLIFMTILFSLSGLIISFTISLMLNIIFILFLFFVMYGKIEFLKILLPALLFSICFYGYKLNILCFISVLFILGISVIYFIMKKGDHNE